MNQNTEEYTFGKKLKFSEWKEKRIKLFEEKLDRLNSPKMTNLNNFDNELSNFFKNLNNKNTSQSEIIKNKKFSEEGKI